MNIQFEGRTVLVTGAAHGFGRTIAGAFALRGARVWACDVLAEELAQTGVQVGEACVTRVVDVTDARQVDTWVAEALHKTDRIDILVNNAGGVLGQVGRPVEEVTPAEWEGILAVNLTGAFLCARAAAPAMKEAAYGRIVNISSGAGLRVSLTGIQAYASAKAGQIGLTRQLAHELGAFGITVNNVAPGFVRSNEATERQWESYGEDGQRSLVERVAMRRLGTPADIAHAVMFFASDYASWITGEVLAVDGGR